MKESGRISTANVCRGHVRQCVTKFSLSFVYPTIFPYRVPGVPGAFGGGASRDNGIDVRELGITEETIRPRRGREEDSPIARDSPA